MKKNYSNLFENTFNFGNNMGQPFFFWNTHLDNAATALKKLLYALCKVQKSMSKKLVLYSDSNSSWSFFEKKHLLWDQDEINMTDSTSLLDHELKHWIAIHSLKCDIHKKVTTVLVYCWIWFRKPALDATITLLFFQHTN